MCSIDIYIFVCLPFKAIENKLIWDICVHFGACFQVRDVIQLTEQRSASLSSSRRKQAQGREPNNDLFFC